MASRERSAPVTPLLYTAQDVARFCEVDLKTIHNWSDAKKIAHHRTEGRHLRFRRNDVVRFLRAHDYPLPDELTSVRPIVYVIEDQRFPSADLKLARFHVQTFSSAAIAIATLVSGQPDALVIPSDDPTWAGSLTLRALKADETTAWPLVIVVGDPVDGADLVISVDDVTRLGPELMRALAID